MRADWGDYDATGGRLVLHRRKVGDLLAMPLGDPVKAQLWQAWAGAGMPKAGSIVVGEAGTAVTPEGARTEFRMVAHAIGLPWLRLATARKWAATVTDEEVGLVAAQRLLGHSSSRVTEGYIRGGEDRARFRAVEAVSGALSRAVATVPGKVGARGGS